MKIKLISLLSGLAVSTASTLALADIAPGGGGGGCSMAASSGQMTIAGVMFAVGAVALVISRRRKG
jgi:hypothetical protein